MKTLSPPQKLPERRRASVPPSSLRMWQLWMTIESVPTLVAAYRLGLFDGLAEKPHTRSQLESAFDLSERAAIVLLGALESLGLICKRGEFYGLSGVAKRYLTKNSKNRKWHLRIEAAVKAEITPEKYFKSLTKLQERAPSEKVREEERKLWKILERQWHFPSLYAALKSGLINSLIQYPSKEQVLANALGISRNQLQRILHDLKSYGVVKTNSKREWKLTEVGRCYLDPRSSHNWGGIVTMMSEAPALPSALYDAICKEQREKNSSTDQMMEHVLSPQLARIFAQHMHSQGSAAAVALAQHPSIRKAHRLLDVAGGGGTYSLAISKENPQMQLAILEIAPMDAIAKEWIRLERAERSIEVLTGNMFSQSWPSWSPDTIFFSHVFHDWGPEKIRFLLKQAYEALPNGGQVVVHEVLLGGPPLVREIAHAFSVTLYRWTHGRQYEASELWSLMESVGFTVKQRRPSPIHGPSSLLCAIK